MLVSSKWLRAHVELDNISDEEIASKLTFAGVEVEDITRLASGTNLVIGEILSCENHPDSDHLHILQVDEGKIHGVHQIVCGAPNARKGLKVIVARTGAVLPEVTIAPSKIRGVDSDGMCCSLLELGIPKKMLSEEQTKGIEELPVDAPVGEENVLGYLGLDDTILDLSLLANRPDLYSLENVAREVATLFHANYKLDDLHEYKESSNRFVADSLTENCDRFGTILVKDVTTKESPKWMKELLRSEGIRSINNIVDIGNFVMLLTGQPLNMYDADKLPEAKLSVQNDIEGDWVAMDDKTYHLEKGDLCVCSKGRCMCLAGIMTSKECEVTPETKNVVVEAAHFDGASIRKTSNRLGLSSDSSQRFVKGTNLEIIDRALKMAAVLLLDEANAKEVSEIYDFRTAPKKEKTIDVTLDYINDRLGTSFDEETIINTLTADHLKIVKEGNLMHVEIPSYRLDIDGKADLSEEVIRLLGLDNISSSLPSIEATNGGLTEAQRNKIAIRRLLRNQGLTEVITYTLTKESNISAFNYLAKGEAYKVLNPLTEDRSYVRLSLLPSLLEVSSYNAAHQVKDLAIFEVSDVDSTTYKGLRLAAVLSGNKEIQSSLKEEAYDFYDVKGIVLSILNLLGIQDNRYDIKVLSSDKEEFHPGRSAVVTIGKDTVAVLGALHPKALKAYGLKNAVALEIDLGYLLNLKVGPIKAKVPNKFPAVTRDLAFLVNKDVDFASIKKEIKRSDKLITDVKIFDTFEGLGIPLNKKSLALTFEFSAADRTLTDGEINALMDKIIGILKMKFLAEVR